jgi:sodium/hydrogen exchanger 8
MCRFQVKKKQFFRNFIAIMLFGVVGVFISFAIISAGTRYMFTKLGLKKLSMRDYLGVYSPLSHSSACLWTRRTP